MRGPTVPLESSAFLTRSSVRRFKTIVGGIVGRKLYVGNLPYSATEEALSEKFGEFGGVDSAKLIIDRDTGRSKGFGFVEMSTDAEAQAAIDVLDGTDYDGRPMKVNEAKPQEKRTGGGGGRGGFGGGGNRW
jgi:RNA recognition motif-containing protein